MGTGYNPRIVTENLVFCVDAANIRSYPKTGTTWTDLKGGNNGTLNNMTFADNYSTDNGGVFIFDGSDEYCLFPYSASSNISAFAWVKFDDFTGASIVKNWGGSLRGAFHFDASTQGAGYLALYIYAGSQTFIKDNFLLSTNTWYYTGFTISGSKYSIYRDGNEVASSSHGGLSILDRPNLGVGCKLNNDGTSADPTYPNHLNGNISNVSIYDRELSADEIRQNYLATKERYA